MLIKQFGTKRCIRLRLDWKHYYLILYKRYTKNTHKKKTRVKKMQKRFFIIYGNPTLDLVIPHRIPSINEFLIFNIRFLFTCAIFSDNFEYTCILLCIVMS